MGTLVQRLYPKAHFCSWAPYPSGYGTHTSAGVSTSVESGDCSTYCDDLFGALDETNYAMARSSATAGQVNLGRFEWTFEDPPVNITISRLTLVAYVRTSSANTATINSAPTVKFFVDPATGTRDYAATADTLTALCNRNQDVPAGSFERITKSWASKPGGGAWTRSQLLSGSFKAGLASDGTYGSGIDASTGGSAASFDVAAFWVELETTPSGLYTEPIRGILSHQLRLLRRPLRTLTMDVPAEFADVEPGETIWASHTLLPVPGSTAGYKAWEQVPLYVTSVADKIDPPTLTMTALDLRPAYASFYSPFQILGVDAQNSGLAKLDRGGNWETDRSQVTFVPRPGDGLYQEVDADSPALSRYGLLIQGGAEGSSSAAINPQDQNWLLNSAFNIGSTNAFTAWAKSTAGGGTANEDGNDYLIDSPGWQRSVKLVSNSSENVSLQQTTSTLDNTTYYCRVWYKNDSASTEPLTLTISRTSDNYCWNPSSTSLAWEAFSPDYRLPLSSGSVASWKCGPINDLSSAVLIKVGLAPVSTNSTAHLYSVEWQSAVSLKHSQRLLLPSTTAGPKVRIRDITSINNTVDFRVWDISRGWFRFSFEPLWSHSDLANSETVYLLNAPFKPGGSHYVTYTRNSSGSGFWNFSGAAVNTSTSGGPALPSAGTGYVIAGRWTSAATNELDLDGQAFDMWVDGVKGSTTSNQTELSSTDDAGQATLYIGLDTAGSTAAVEADGYFTDMEIVSGWCPTDDEMERV